MPHTENKNILLAGFFLQVLSFNKTGRKCEWEMSKIPIRQKGASWMRMEGNHHKESRLSNWDCLRMIVLPQYPRNHVEKHGERKSWKEPGGRGGEGDNT